MGRTRTSEHVLDPATSRPLPAGVSFRGELQYQARKPVDGKRIRKTFESAHEAAGICTASVRWLRGQPVFGPETIDAGKLPEVASNYDQATAPRVLAELELESAEADWPRRDRPNSWMYSLRVSVCFTERMR